MAGKRPVVYLAGDMTTDVFLYRGTRGKIESPKETGTRQRRVVGVVGWLARLFRSWESEGLLEVRFPKSLEKGLEAERLGEDPGVKPSVYYYMSHEPTPSLESFWGHVEQYIDRHPNMVVARASLHEAISTTTKDKGCFRIWRCKLGGELRYGAEGTPTEVFCAEDRRSSIPDNSVLVLFDQDKHISKYGLERDFPRFGRLESIVFKFTNPRTRLKSLLTNRECRTRVAIISTYDLRAASGNRSISLGFSWERTVVDLLTALRQHGDLRWLVESVEQDALHLVVQIGNEGALYIHQENGTKKQTLFFAESALEGDSWNTRVNGIVPGCDEGLAASIALSVACEERISEVADAVERGILGGLKAARRLNLVGHRLSDASESTDARAVDIGTREVAEEIRKVAVPRLQRPLNEFRELDAQRVPSGLRDALEGPFNPDELLGQEDDHVKVDTAGSKWRIVARGRPLSLVRRQDRLDVYDADHLEMGRCDASDVVDDQGVPNREWRIAGKDWKNADDSVDLATRLAERGLAAFGAPHLGGEIPVLKIGRITSVDRKEIERLRILRNLISEYEQQTASVAPLSVAVFGPPGTGKGFAVKELVREVLGASEHDAESRFLTWNLSEVDCPHGLVPALHEVRDRVLKGRTPIVFWDEFDSGEYQWLRHFLALMQDGEFRDGPLVHPIGKCVFVFAGGVCHSFDQFNSEDSNSKRQDRWFRNLKGPDFISRLSGYLDVMGPNCCAEDDYCWPLRRAVLLRSLLRCDRTLDMDGDLLRGLLKTRHFHHGSRSMEKIARAFAGRRHASERITLSDLPPEETLSLHVDYKDFMQHVRERDERCAEYEATKDIVERRKGVEE